MKKFISIILSVLICVSLSLNVFATETSNSPFTVDYTNAQGFIFNPDEGDLFHNFKGVMPGDDLEQRIFINNYLPNREITLYLRAETNKEYEEFLKHIYMTVAVVNDDGTETVISKGLAHTPNQLVQDINLGTYKPKETAYINVKIHVDKEMNNDFKKASGVIDWIFSAEEGEIYNPPGDNPVTGQQIAYGVFTVLGIGITVLVILFVRDKKKNKNNDVSSVDKSSDEDSHY